MAAASNTIESDTKKCGGCGRVLPRSDFSKNRTRLNSRCKTCAKEYARKYRQSDHGRAKWREWRSRPDVVERQREHRKKPERRKYDTDKSRLWHRQPHVKERRLKQRRTPEALERTRLYNRVYARERAARDPVYKMRRRLHSEIASALKGKRRARQWWQAACGYTVEELRRHLEALFTDGMSWENHGTLWEIDHIRPVASFNIKSIESAAFRAAWALLNLRPLLKTLNRAKGAAL